MHTCMHGRVSGWLRVFSHAWTAVYIFTCVNDWAFGSLPAWLHGQNQKFPWFYNSTFTLKNPILTLCEHVTIHILIHTLSHTCMQKCKQPSIHAKIHAAIHACDHAHKRMYGCMHGWMCTWIKLFTCTFHAKWPTVAIGLASVNSKTQYILSFSDFFEVNNK